MAARRHGTENCGEPQEQRLLVVGQPLVARRDERMHRRVPLSATPARPELVEPLVERVGELRRAHVPEPADDELDAERHELDALGEAVGDDVGEIVDPHAGGALAEQGDRHVGAQ